MEIILKKNLELVPEHSTKTKPFHPVGKSASFLISLIGDISEIIYSPVLLC